MYVNEITSGNAPELVSVMDGSYAVCERKPYNTDFGVMRFFMERILLKMTYKSQLLFRQLMDWDQFGSFLNRMVIILQEMRVVMPHVYSDGMVKRGT